MPVQIRLFRLAAPLGAAAEAVWPAACKLEKKVRWQKPGNDLRPQQMRMQRPVNLTDMGSLIDVNFFCGVVRFASVQSYRRQRHSGLSSSHGCA